MIGNYVSYLHNEDTFYLLNSKKAGGRGFSKNVFCKEGMKPVFSLALNIVISHIFPENFIGITQVVQKIWRLSISVLAIFINFHPFFVFFDIPLI